MDPDHRVITRADCTLFSDGTKIVACDIGPISTIKFKKSTWLCRSFVPLRPSVRHVVRSCLWYFLSPLDGASVRERIASRLAKRIVYT